MLPKVIRVIPLFLVLLSACDSPTGRVAGGLGKASEAQTACGVGVDLSIYEKDGQEQICYDKKSKILYFTIMNQVNNRITAVDATVYSAGGVFPLAQSRSSERGLLFNGRAYYDDQFGSIEKVRLSPTVEIDGVSYSCQGQSLTLSSISDC
jgi:hypothetical protein